MDALGDRLAGTRFWLSALFAFHGAGALLLMRQDGQFDSSIASGLALSVLMALFAFAFCSLLACLAAGLSTAVARARARDGRSPEGIFFASFVGGHLLVAAVLYFAAYAGDRPSKVLKLNRAMPENPVPEAGPSRK